MASVVEEISAANDFRQEIEAKKREMLDEVFKVR